MSKSTSIVERLRTEIRRAEKRGITQAELARMAGIPESQVSRIRRGMTMPRLDTAETIFRVLRMKITIGRRD